VELEAAMAVARRRSFRAASSDLGVSPTALSQTIAGLEARLGVRLFNRTTRSVSPTNAGESPWGSTIWIPEPERAFASVKFV
jgi:DNA-binding transcriptional LysR family regulator